MLTAKDSASYHKTDDADLGCRKIADAIKGSDCSLAGDTPGVMASNGSPGGMWNQPNRAAKPERGDIPPAERLVAVKGSGCDSRSRGKLPPTIRARGDRGLFTGSLSEQADLLLARGDRSRLALSNLWPSPDSKKKRLNKASVVTLLMAAFWVTAVRAESFKIECTVLGAAASDTLELRCGLVRKMLRLDNIDGPENGQPYGDTGRVTLAAALVNAPLTVTVDGEDAPTQWHGTARLANGWDLGTQLVSMGIAWPAPGSTNPRMAGMFEDAQKNHAGLWATETQPVAPWEWRRLHPSGTAPATREAFVVTDETLVHGDWSALDAQGRRNAAESLSEAERQNQLYRGKLFIEDMKYRAMRRCYFRSSRASVDLCLAETERQYPGNESTPTPLERGVVN